MEKNVVSCETPPDDFELDALERMPGAHLMDHLPCDPVAVDRLLFTATTQVLPRVKEHKKVVRH